jgi:hypothetical protein
MFVTILVAAAFLAFGIYVAWLVVPVVVRAVVPEVGEDSSGSGKGGHASVTSDNRYYVKYRAHSKRGPGFRWEELVRA